MLRFTICFLMLSVFLTGCPSPQPSGGGNLTEKDVLVVVVHKSNKISNISISKLKDIYKADQEKWADGKIIKPLHFVKNSPERESFSKVALGYSSHGMFTHYWQGIYQGGSSKRAATEYPTASKVLAMVNANKSAIAYLPLSAYQEIVKRKTRYKVKMISLENVKASLSDAKSGQYALVVNK